MPSTTGPRTTAVPARVAIERSRSAMPTSSRQTSRDADELRQPRCRVIPGEQIVTDAGIEQAAHSHHRGSPGREWQLRVSSSAKSHVADPTEVEPKVPGADP